MPPALNFYLHQNLNFYLHFNFYFNFTLAFFKQTQGYFTIYFFVFIIFNWEICMFQVFKVIICSWEISRLNLHQSWNHMSVML
jgi:hypothetical protein